MKIQVIQQDATQAAVPALIINIFEGTKTPDGVIGKIDKALDGTISQLISEREITGKRGEKTLIHTLGKLAPSRVLVAGLGKLDSFNVNTIRDITAETSRYLRGLGISKIATIAHGTGLAGIEPEESALAIAEGFTLGLYRFRTYLNVGEEEPNNIDEILIIEQDSSKIAALERGIVKGTILSDAATLTRDMINEPANVLTPTRMADVAKQVADSEGLTINILERDDMKELGMGALLGVAQGSAEPPKLIVLQYSGDPENPNNNLGLVGKGITFDSGGLSLKPPSGMEEMKRDMSGGASVIGALKAIAQLKPKINVTGIVAATENMPGPSAQRPGDIVRTMSGKTIEVLNTDAEGRLVLADAISYARQMGLTRLVDIATLTGAIVVALGNVCIGVMGNNQNLIDEVIQAGQDSGERMWQLPMHDDYKDDIKSTVANVKNVGGRGAGSIAGAMLLAEFSEDTPWVHLDIAGTAWTTIEKGAFVKGATGVPCRALVNLALKLAKP